MKRSIAQIAVSVIAFVKLVADFAANHRIESNITTGGLYRDIFQNGLDEPMTVEKNADGTYLVLQGHRRMKALSRILQNDPKRFSELFSDGVQCRVVDVADDAERTRIRADHGNKVGLTKGEVSIQWRDLLQKGHTKATIQVRLFDQLCDVAKKRLYRSEDESVYGTEDAASSEQENAFFQAQIAKLTGLLQTMSASAKMPNVIFKDIVFLLDNKPGWSVKMTEAEIRKLGPVLSKDLESGAFVDEEGFTPNLRKVWNEYRADKTRDSNEDVRKAAVAAKKAGTKRKEDENQDGVTFDIATQIQAAKSETGRRALVAIQKAINGDLATWQSFDDEHLEREKANPKKEKANA